MKLLTRVLPLLLLCGFVGCRGCNEKAEEATEQAAASAKEPEPKSAPDKEPEPGSDEKPKPGSDEKPEPGSDEKPEPGSDKEPEEPSSPAEPAKPLDWVSFDAGSFKMGTDGGDDDEGPAHRVKVAAFEMNRTEVTVGQYRVCVDAEKCQAPATGPKCNWAQSDREEHPVNCLAWLAASDFCDWAGGTLPSEAQWEYAATGLGEARTYPWGAEPADCKRAVMPKDKKPGCGAGGTAPVCSRPSGNGEGGLCDLAGNVWEWMADCWHRGYKGAPVDGSAWTTACKEKGRRVVRGSSFLNGTLDNMRSASRDSSSAEDALHSIGFRCARAPAPQR